MIILRWLLLSHVTKERSAILNVKMIKKTQLKSISKDQNQLLIICYTHILGNIEMSRTVFSLLKRFILTA